jgi:hypothetical protein
MPRSTRFSTMSIRSRRPPSSSTTSTDPAPARSDDIRGETRAALEGGKCLDTGVLASAADANIRSIFGAGFPHRPAVSSSTSTSTRAAWRDLCRGRTNSPDGAVPGSPRLRPSSQGPGRANLSSRARGQVSSRLTHLICGYPKWFGIQLGNEAEKSDLGIRLVSLQRLEG